MIVDKPDREAVLSYAPSSTTDKGLNSHRTSQEPLPPSPPPQIDGNELSNYLLNHQKITFNQPLIGYLFDGLFVGSKRQTCLHLVQSWIWSGQTGLGMVQREREGECWRIPKRCSRSGGSCIDLLGVLGASWWPLTYGSLSHWFRELWWLMA